MLPKKFINGAPPPTENPYFAVIDYCMRDKKQAALGFIFITLFIDVIGWGIIIPVMPTLIEQLIHGNVSQAATYGGLLNASYAVMQLLFAPVLGNLSDRYGRRPVLLISLFGFSMDYIFQALSTTIVWLFIGRVIAGITGSSFTTASAYIADISNEENRAKNFGLIGAAFGLGFIVGPVIGGLLGQYGPRVPFYAAAVLCLLNWLYGYFILPESLDKQHRRPFDWKRANPVGSFKLFERYTSLGPLVTALTLIYIAAHAVQSNWNFYTMYKFSWNEKLIGISLGVIGVLVALVQGWLIRYINPRLGNEKSVYVGLGLYAIGMLMFGFANQSWMMFAFCVPYCLGGIAGPALQSIISRQVLPNEQGELQGALTSLMSATSIIGPLIMTNLFSFFTNKNAPVQFAGAPFILGAILLVISTFLARRSLHPPVPVSQPL
jgi:DHA1 family tetracycline resistance protein-like MFS transporter